MLVLANLSGHKVNASQIYGKLVKCQEQIFDYLFLCSKYQHTSTLKQVIYCVCNICTQTYQAKCQDVYPAYVRYLRPDYVSVCKCVHGVCSNSRQGDGSCTCDDAYKGIWCDERK